MAYSQLSNPFGITLTTWVKRLLIANTAVFLLTWAFRLEGSLAFVPAEFLSRPWTVLTYMFVHANFWHLLFNMLGLLFFGPVLEDRWGSREFIKFYLICGFAGGLFSLIFPYQAIVGASAAIYGVLVAFAMYWPDNPIYIWGIFPIKAKWLVSFMVAISVFYTLSGGQGGVAHLAHLGGALAAFVYLKSPLAPPEWGNVYGSNKRKRRKKPWDFLRRRRLAVESASRTDAAAPARAARPARRQPEEIDVILDKISAGGINSLTAEERQRLEEASRRFRTS
jgi:membrane associated rhomboid family serine protease